MFLYLTLSVLVVVFWILKYMTKYIDLVKFVMCALVSRVHMTFYILTKRYTALKPLQILISYDLLLLTYPYFRVSILNIKSYFPTLDTSGLGMEFNPLKKKSLSVFFEL